MLLAVIFLGILAVAGVLSVLLDAPLAFSITLGLALGIYALVYGGMAILLLRGWRSRADRAQYRRGLDTSPWAVALKPKVQVERFLANSALMGHRPVSDEVYAWYGDDALAAHRAAYRVKWCHGHFPEDVLTAIADAGIRDYESVMTHLDRLDLPDAIAMSIALREGIPFEYAKAMHS